MNTRESKQKADAMASDERAKQRLRDALRSRRESLEPAAARAMAEAAQGRVLALDAWWAATSVLAYAAVRGEVDTELLLRQAWDSGKTVLLPRCAPAGGHQKAQGRMDCCCVAGPEQLVPGAYAIPEPDPDRCPAHKDPAPSIAVIPAVAFDRRGMRLGQGGGYYDRLLIRPSFSDTLLVGLAYDFQILDHVPAEEWDIPVQCICTDKETLWL